jgi:SAM-dependent methyltransferase
VEARPRDLLSRQGDYGFDAPAVPLFLGGGGVVLVGFAILSATVGDGEAWALLPLLGGLFMLLSAASFLYTTRVGKFAVWAEILRNLGLRGDEQVLDMGCGRGAVLLMIAKLLPRGRAVGLDLWRTVDQSGNSMEMTLENGDITQMPFPDGSFDVVLSALAIHNIKDRRARLKAIDEAVRVLRRGGRLVIADIRYTTEYADRLRELGMSEVQVRGLGWRYWYGGPWVATTLVTAKKP